MCGIAMKYNIDGTAVNEDIFNMYVDQRNRGKEGFGVFDVSEMNLVKNSNEDKMISWLSKYDSNFLVFHHRFPTSTLNTKRTAHPISTKGYFGNTQYVMVHNGIIYNDDDLHKAHTELGI